MVNYNQWPMKRLAVTSLFLDPENPRIPATEKAQSQRDLIAELIQHDNVLDLAKSIAENGYHPNEVLVAFHNKSDGNRYIVEGNRRAAALKCLLSPDAAPEGFQSKFTKLAADVDPKALAKVFVLIAPSRKAAIPLLLDRHTHLQIESWSRPMQARFIHRLLEDGMTVEQVAAASRKTASEVRNLITAYVLYAAACSLDLDSNVHGKIANPRTFPLSALERAFESKLVCDFLGVQRNDAKLLSGRVAPSEFLKGFTTIVSDVATGKVNTRKLNNNEGIKQYLESIKYKKPDLSKKGTFEIQQLVKTGASVKGTPKPPTPKKKTPRPSASVIPTIIKCSCASKRIKDVFGELRRLHLEKFPNASAVLLRTLIDLCVTNFLERTKEMKTLLAHHQTKNNKQKDWAPSLHQMLDHLLHKMDCGLEGQALTALRTFHSSKRTVLCLDGLDKFTHNKYLTPQPDELKNIWTIVEPLMEIILVDPE